jgi:nitrate/TMAO reductase-like tetraheme cytochrome c subunit
MTARTLLALVLCAGLASPLAAQAPSVRDSVIATRGGTRAGGAGGPVQCEKCHADRQFLVGKSRTAGGDSVLFVPDTLLRDSRHRTLVCADCHEGYNDGYPHVRVARVSIDCQGCHELQGRAWTQSVHEPTFVKTGDAPTCVSCHGAHRVLGSGDRRSPTHPLRVAQLCGSCHTSPKILRAYFERPADSTARTVAGDYKASVHGLAMTRAGLAVSATCSDCHDSHRVLPPDSAASSISRANVSRTCGECHVGVLTTYAASAHGKALVSGDTTVTGKRAPLCTDCHGGHTVVAASDDVWFRGVVQECGACHERALETYAETYHGKATELFHGVAAKCSDCHTAHAMLPADDTASSVHPSKLVGTCAQCHEGANANFVQYKPHGDPRDREKDPELFWVWALMTALLVGVFAFFGTHSVLFLVRLLRERGRRGHDPDAGDDAPPPRGDPPAPLPEGA